MSIIKSAPNLYEIRLSLEMTRFNSLLSTWVYKDNKICFLVDPGPKSTINSLRVALTKLGINKIDLDYILLTHIHIDHAGGVGKLILSFPEAQIICHPKGVKHLINPEKLWEGSLKVLGVIAEKYGNIIPVPEERIQVQESMARDELKIIETLGHSPHHQSYLFNQYLFVGEAAGTHYPLTEKIYIRPATPPVFNYEIAISSIKKLIARNLIDHMICYAHYGMRKNADLMLKIALQQLPIWLQVIDDMFEKRDHPNFITYAIEALKMKDKNFANLNLLDQKSREKEVYFIGNSIKGITNYIKKKRC